MVVRVVLMGAESSGKTTLAKDLALDYQTWWVPEYWRFYWDAKCVAKNIPIWRTEEFVHIAQMQNHLEDHYASRADRFLFVDTDAFMTAAWHFRYLSHNNAELDALWQIRNRDLILFCAPDIPFVQDGTRDGEHIRHGMATWIRSRLDEHGMKYTEISGSQAERLATAKRALDAI